MVSTGGGVFWILGDIHVVVINASGCDRLRPSVLIEYIYTCQIYLKEVVLAGGSIL